MEARGPNVATWLGYGGALGGRKSGAIRRVMLAHRGMYPKTVGVIVRRVLADVKENHIQKFWEEYPELRSCYNATDYEIVLRNGSRIKFMYAENSQEVDRKFYGPEFFDIFIDQAEQFSEGELRTINARNRAPGAPDGLCKMGLFFNPGGCGTEFLRRVFWLKQYHGNERASDYAFIQSYGWDNYEWPRGTGARTSALSASFQDELNNASGISSPRHRCSSAGQGVRGVFQIQKDQRRLKTCTADHSQRSPCNVSLNDEISSSCLAYSTSPHTVRC